MNRELKQTDTAATNLQFSIQKDSKLSEFSRPLTAITLNLNGDLHVDRRRVSLLKLPNHSRNNAGIQNKSLKVNNLLPTISSLLIQSQMIKNQRKQQKKFVIWNEN